MKILITLATVAACASPSEQRLAFIHDDFARARVEAIARGVPVFVEASAAW
jgi:hypothetical protein